MRDAKEKVGEFMDILLEGLGDKLACVLLQLPPSYTYSEERMDDIINNVPNQSMYVIEFRHQSWWNGEVYERLKRNNLTFYSVSFPGLPEDNIITSNIFYKRMHGVPDLFKSEYTVKQLKALASDIPKGLNSYVYFNNTSFEAGYTNALMLDSLVK
jgi:uncharacterized protein YecE (DUF72 family)